MGRGSLLASSIFRLTGLSKRFSRDGVVMMIIGTADLLNDEGGGEDDNDDDDSLLRDSSTVRKKKVQFSLYLSAFYKLLTVTCNHPLITISLITILKV